MDNELNVNSQTQGLIHEYENTLINEGEGIKPSYFSQRPNHLVLKNLLLHVFLNILKWTPEDVYSNLDSSLVEQMKLKNVIAALEFPEELDPQEDLWYVATILWPEQFPYDRDYQAVSTYLDVLDHKLPRLPKWFFSSMRGEINATLCMNTALNRFCTQYSIKELYALFADRVSANRILAQARLTQAANNFFDSPLDMLHKSLTKENQSQLYYNFYRLKNEMSEAKLLLPYDSRSDRDEFLAVRKAFDKAFNERFFGAGSGTEDTDGGDRQDD